ncbi:MAG: hypothetical protein QOI80_1308 [Solirubrobacteraceae bacterium]|nr:hypothetical protein [Solirubrobacteraceae bacterium]
MNTPAKPDPRAEPLLKIEDLSRRVGMSVRNLREWRTLGLLPPAEIRGRVGYYDQSVVERVERIQELRAEGFTLDLIRRMLDVSGESGGEVMRFARDLRAPFRDDEPPRVDLDAWAAGWGSKDPKALERALAIGLIRRRPDGELEFTSSRVDRIGTALQELGLSLTETLDAAAEIRAHADAVAELFERVWLERVWQPFLDAGSPDDQLPTLQQRLATVQPMAMDAVVALFTVAMEAQIEHGIAREAERAAARRR